MEWSNEQVSDLIDTYRERPVLWDSRLPEHKDRDKRHEALLEISMLFETDKEEIERKLKNLLSHFARENKKEKEIRTTKNGSSICYKSKWFAYDSMQFLKERNKSKETTEVLIKQDYSDEQQYEENLQECTEDKGVNSRKENRKRIFRSPKRRIESIKRSHPSTPVINEILSLIKSIQKKKEEKDEYDVFGEEVAIKLRKLKSPHARYMVQSIINNALFQAEIGKYDDI